MSSSYEERTLSHPWASRNCVLLQNVSKNRIFFFPDFERERRGHQPVDARRGRQHAEEHAGTDSQAARPVQARGLQ